MSYYYLHFIDMETEAPPKNQNSEKNHLQFYSPNLTDILMHVFPIILEGGFEFKILGLLGGLCWKMVA